MKCLKIKQKFKILIFFVLITLLASCSMYDPTTSPLVIYPKPSLKVVGHFDENKLTFSVYPDVTDIINEKLKNNNVNAIMIDEVRVGQTIIIPIPGLNDAEIKGSLVKAIEPNNVITQPHSFSWGAYVKNVKVVNNMGECFILKAKKRFIVY